METTRRAKITFFFGGRYRVLFFLIANEGHGFE